jgi:hypothetical protein
MEGNRLCPDASVEKPTAQRRCRGYPLVLALQRVAAEVFGSGTNSSAVLNMITFKYLLIPDDQKDEEPQTNAKNAYVWATHSYSRSPRVITK